MLRFEAVAQIIHRRCQPNSLDLGQRIATGIDHAAQSLCFLAGVGCRPVRIATDCLAPFASCRGPVIQDESPGVVGGDAQAESGDLAVPVDLVAGGRRASVSG